jgi:peptidoglycan glycosyltransferase
MNRIALRAIAIWALVALLLGGVGFFLVEYFLKGDQWVVSQGSPHVYNEFNIGTGTVVDRNGNLLMQQKEELIYTSDEALRKATIHWIGDRVGNIHAPAVPHYAEELIKYNPVTGIYVYSEDATAALTLSSELQKIALEAMGAYKGTVAVYNYKTGEILCAVTTPNYDPDNVPDIEGDTTGAYTGVYMNRFTQSVYIPGSIFKTVTVAAALEEIPDIREQIFTCTGLRKYGIDKVTCEHAHGKLTFEQALTQSCNCAFSQIADQLGGETLQKYVEKYQITESVSFDGITTAKGNVSLQDAAPVQVAWSAIGQHKDQINPCRFLTYMGAIANGGQAVEPHIVGSISRSGQQTYRAQPALSDRIMPEEVAAELQKMMRKNVVNKYGADNFPGLTVCAKSGTGQVGGNQKSNAMFTGFVMDEEYPLAFIVSVENAGYGREVCVPILQPILAQCKTMLDSQS